MGLSREGRARRARLVAQRGRAAKTFIGYYSQYSVTQAKTETEAQPTWEPAGRAG